MAELINTEQELEDRLSRPSAADVAAASQMAGDLMILGAGGKMGPSLAVRARRAAEQAGVRRRVIAVARFSKPDVKLALQTAGVETISCDLLESDALTSLPDAPNLVFMVARKFGTTESEYLTWALNTYLPAKTAERFRDSRIVAFSTGNVYPLRKAICGGAGETDELAPAGEYAQSALGRERLLEYVSRKWQIPMTILRLNYAVDLRYGVLSDICQAVYERRPVDLGMGAANVIWQGDANSICLRSLAYCSTPPTILNVSGPETLSIRHLAQSFAVRFGVEAIFNGEESETALLTNAEKAHQLFGYPSVTIRQLVDWTAHWVRIGGVRLGKPTHFEVRDGKF